MQRYLDTSVLVAMLVREAGTEAAKACLSAASGDDLLISPWTATELSSALALKRRMAAIDAAEQTAALAMFVRLRSDLLRTCEIGDKDYGRAAHLCDQSEIPVRAGDALHLAVCARAGARLVTFDAGMATAARHHGLRCDLLHATTSPKEPS